MQSIINLPIRAGLLLIVAAVLAGGIALATPQHAHAQTETVDVSSLIEQLKARILELQTQLANMRASDSDVSQPAVRNVVADADFARNLSMGDRGADVRRLQQLLNKDPDTRVAVSGDGAQGRETNYFGPATANAVKRFQEKYQQEILAPVGLQSGSGFFGPGTRSKLARLFSGVHNDSDGASKPDALRCPQVMACGPGTTAVKTGVSENQCTLWECVAVEQTLRDIRRISITIDETANVTTVEIKMNANKSYAYVTTETDRDDIVEELRKKLASRYDVALTGFSTRGAESYLERLARWDRVEDTEVDDDASDEDTAEENEFTLDDVRHVTKKNVDPRKLVADDEYTLYTIMRTNGKTHEVKVYGMMLRDMVEEMFRNTGYAGDVDDLRAMAKEEDVKSDDSNTCYSYNPKGTRTFSEGETTQSYYTKEGRQVAIADAHLVCRNGEWKREGSLPDRDTSNQCYSYNPKGTRTFSEGETTQSYYTKEGRQVAIADARLVCRSGEWKASSHEPLDRLEPLLNGCIDMNSSRFDRLVAEGTITESYRDAGGEVQSIVDGSYICQDGEWEVKSTHPRRVSEVRGASVTDYQTLLQQIKKALQSLLP